MRIQLSKEKLYEAKWGVLEWYNKWDCSGIGKIHNSPRITGNHVNLSFFMHSRVFSTSKVKSSDDAEEQALAAKVPDLSEPHSLLPQ